MKASLPKVRKGSLDKTHVSYGANAMFGDLMSMAKSLKYKSKTNNNWILYNKKIYKYIMLIYK